MLRKLIALFTFAWSEDQGAGGYMRILVACMIAMFGCASGRFSVIEPPQSPDVQLLNAADAVYAKGGTQLYCYYYRIKDSSIGLSRFCLGGTDNLMVRYDEDPQVEKLTFSMASTSVIMIDAIENEARGSVSIDRVMVSSPKIDGGVAYREAQRRDQVIMAKWRRLFDAAKNFSGTPVIAEGDPLGERFISVEF